jgi:hypothetical protein
LGFSARSLDGRLVAQLSRKMPDRQALFEKSMAQIDQEAIATEQLATRLRAAQTRARALEVMLLQPGDGEGKATAREGVLEASASPSPLALRAAALIWQAAWAWILRLLLRLPWVKRLPRPATSGDETRSSPLREQHATRLAQLEVERAAIEAFERELASVQSVEQVAAHAQRLRLERERYEAERRVTFLSQVRDFDGTDIGERTVEYPAKYLPEGLTLVDLPCPSAAGAPIVEQIRNRVGREADALIVIADVRQPPGKATASLVRELGDVVPLALVVLTKADGPLRRDAFGRVAAALGPNAQHTPCIAVAAEATLQARPGSSPLADHFHATISALSSRLDGERPILLAWREAMRMRIGLAELSHAQAREEESCRTRLSKLESKRIPDPAEFRGRLLKRVDGAIEKGADDVLAAATLGLHTAIEGLRAEWNVGISSCAVRSDVEVCVAAINESAARRIAEALEQTAELVARELHDVTETLETWAVEEILAPVASELTREDLERELLAVQPFEGALDAFEKQRVGYGLGGAAAGAVLGTLIAPGIGTAVGAVLGVLAGLLKGTDSLKQECITKIDACLTDTESHARAQLQSKRPDLSRVIRVTLDEALDEALARLNDAIARLMAIERTAIDRERAKLEALTATRGTLEACDARLMRLVDCALGRR